MGFIPLETSRKSCTKLLTNFRVPTPFKIEDIDPTLCTHAFYGFADINNEVKYIHEN